MGIDRSIPSYYHARIAFREEPRVRGPDEQTADMFSYLSPEQRVRPDHPLRAIRTMTDQVLRELSPRFQRMYSDVGRPSIPPEQLLRALLLQALYTVRSERLLMEEIDYSILFRWFIGLSLDEPIWSPTVFSKNRDRLLTGDIASAFFDAVLRQAREAALLSDEHFTVDGTLLDAWAGLKSFQRTDAGPTPPPDDPGNPTVNFHGETRTNETHRSTTDPDAQLYRKGPGKEAKLTYMGHVLLDNRHGLVTNVCATAATGTAEREAAALLEGMQLGSATDGVADVLVKIYRAFCEKDAELVEINPLAILRGGKVVALDCKFVLDDASTARQPDLVEVASPAKMTVLEERGAAHGLRFIQLDGNVGVLANGAGLTMTTMDVIDHFGGRPANFLEIGGEAYTKAEVALDLGRAARPPTGGPPHARCSGR